MWSTEPSTFTSNGSMIVVSNRLPFVLKRNETTGQLERKASGEESTLGGTTRCYAVFTATFETPSILRAVLLAVAFVMVFCYKSVRG